MSHSRRRRLAPAVPVVSAAVLLGVILTWDLIVDAPRGRSSQPAEPAVAFAGGRDATTRRTAPPQLLREGERAFHAQCSVCHGVQADWPIAARLKGRTADECYALLDHLPAVNPAMPGFRGTDEQRRALAAYLASLPSSRPSAP